MLQISPQQAMKQNKTPQVHSLFSGGWLTGHNENNDAHRRHKFNSKLLLLLLVVVVPQTIIEYVLVSFQKWLEKIGFKNTRIKSPVHEIVHRGERA